MRGKDNRTLSMIDRFMELHNQGHDLKEIATICQVSYTTVLTNLGTIARNNHVTRNSLLTRVVYADHTNGRDYSPVRPIDSTKFVADVGVAREKAFTIWGKARETIDKNDALDRDMEVLWEG